MLAGKQECLISTPRKSYVLTGRLTLFHRYSAKLFRTSSGKTHLKSPRHIKITVIYNRHKAENIQCDLYLNCPADKECGLNTLDFMLEVILDDPALCFTVSISENDESSLLSSF